MSQYCAATELRHVTDRIHTWRRYGLTSRQSQPRTQEPTSDWRALTWCRAKQPAGRMRTANCSETRALQPVCSETVASRDWSRSLWGGCRDRKCRSRAVGGWVRGPLICMVDDTRPIAAERHSSKFSRCWSFVGWTDGTAFCRSKTDRVGERPQHSDSGPISTSTRPADTTNRSEVGS